MNILYDNIIFDLQKSGGISLYWSELINRQLMNEAVNISFCERNRAFCDNPFRNKLKIPTLSIIKKGKGWPLIIDRYRALSSLPEFRLFHSSYYRCLANAPKETVSIVTAHDFIYERYVKGVRRRIHSWQKYKALAQAKGIICVSNSTRSDLLSLFPEMRKKRVEVIYNGVSEDYRSVNKEAAALLLRKKYAVKTPFMLNVGRRDASYKNFDLLVQVVCNSPGIDLVLVGGGELTSSNKKMLEKKLRNRYLYLPYIPQEDLNSLYNTAFCLLYLSSYEGFGLPLLEAQKAHCPVVAFNSSAIPEVVACKSSLVSELSEGAVRKQIDALRDPFYRREVIETGTANAANFSWDNCYRQTLDFYEEICHGQVKITQQVLSQSN